MSRQIKIDITDKVMNEISSKRIKIRPRLYYILEKTLIFVGSIGAGVLGLAAISAVAFSVKNQVFLDYLGFGKVGVTDFIKTIPWIALLASIAFLAAFIYMAKDFKSVYRYKYVPVALVLLLVVFGGTAYGMKGSNTDSIQSKIAAIFRLNDKSPTKIDGLVEKKENSKIILLRDDKSTVEIKLSSSTIYKNGQPEVGDMIMVLGLSNDNFDALAIKIVRKAEKKKEEKGEVKSENTQASVQPEQPKTTTSAPSTSTKSTGSTPVPAPTPPPVNYSINLSKIQETSTKVKISWTANFSSTGGWKIVRAIGSTPVYPGSSYDYVSSGSTSGTFIAMKTYWGSGTFNVRVCNYNPSTNTCGVYSNPVTITFP